MSSTGNPDITQLLDRWRQGDRSVENALAVRIYPVLRRLANGQVRRQGGLLTLSATELANEAYERLHRQQHVDWRNRDHFFAIAATVLRRVVVDHLRKRSAEKRGGDVEQLTLENLPADSLPGAGGGVDWLAVDQALDALAREDPECARVVELRVFSGLSVERIAEVTQTSTATIGRRWRYARAWLADYLDPEYSRP